MARARARKPISKGGRWLQRSLPKGIPRVTGHQFLFPAWVSPRSVTTKSRSKGARSFRAVDLASVLRGADLEEPEWLRQSIDPHDSLGPGLMVLAFLGSREAMGTQENRHPALYARALAIYSPTPHPGKIFQMAYSVLVHFVLLPSSPRSGHTSPSFLPSRRLVQVKDRSWSFIQCSSKSTLVHS